jgi:hypothetical protein
MLPTNTTEQARASLTVLVSATFLTVLGFAGSATAQAFNSGSTGADGAFDLTGTPSGTIVDFNPKAIHVNKDPNAPLIDPEGDNVFHFTTITIPSGVTVKMSATWTNGPVYWLATGLVEIAGTVNLDGSAGYNNTPTPAQRVLSIPGPGGYPGGLGGQRAATSTGPARPGAGPAGGIAAPQLTTSSDAHNFAGRGGGFSGSPFLVPLIGGSGGGGGAYDGSSLWGGGGGAGGGALLISSSVRINVPASGRISALGGRGGGSGDNHHYVGGSGAGGAIRLVSPILSGTGQLAVSGTALLNNQPVTNGGAGRVRLEAFSHEQGYPITGNWTKGSPLNSFAPTTPPPFIQVTGIAGQAVRPDPTGSFDTADVTINASGAVEITIQARYVRVGTVPKVTLFSLEGNDQVLDGSPLVGTLEQSTSTLMATIPPGFSRGSVRAVWTSDQ